MWIKSKWVKYTLSLISILLLIALLFLSTTNNPNKKPQKWLLLIAIDDYANIHTKLEGSIASLELVEKILAEKYKTDLADGSLNFEKINTVFLKNKQATKYNIIHTLKILAQKVKIGDYVYIHFVGHGGRTTNNKQDTGEYWVLYDTHKNGDNGLKDNELQEIIAKINRKVEKLVFVTDACNALAFDESETEKSIFYTKSLLQISASQHNKNAWEDTIKKTPYNPKIIYSLFSFFWYQSIRYSNNDSSWQDIFNKTNRYLKQFIQNEKHEGNLKIEFQNPKIQGLANVIPFSYMVTSLNPQPILSNSSINMGIYHGINQGSVYFPYKEQVNNKNLFTVKSIKHTNSIINDNSYINNNDVKLIEFKHAPYQQQYLYVLENEVKEELFSNFFKNLMTYRWSNIELADFEIKNSHQQFILESIKANFPSAYISKYSKPQDQYNLLRSFIRIQELQALASRFDQDNIPIEPIKLWGRIFNKTDHCSNSSLCIEHTFNGKRYIFENNKERIEAKNFKTIKLKNQQLLGLELENKTNTNLYVYLFNIGSTGRIELFFPFLMAKINPSHIKINAQQYKPIWNWHKARAILTNDKNSGRQQIKMIVSLKPIKDLQVWEQPGLGDQEIYKTITKTTERYGLWSFYSEGQQN